METRRFKIEKERIRIEWVGLETLETNMPVCCIFFSPEPILNTCQSHLAQVLRLYSSDQQSCTHTDHCNCH